jgi:hypothetical protein
MNTFLTLPNARLVRFAKRVNLSAEAALLESGSLCVTEESLSGSPHSVRALAVKIRALSFSGIMYAHI